MINPGILREEIEVLKQNSEQDGYGDVRKSYEHYLFLKAAVKYASGAKGVENFQEWNSQTLVFTTYPRPIDETMRIVWKGDTYIINSKPLINYDELNIYAERLKG